MFKTAMVVLSTLGLFALFSIMGVFQSNAFVVAGRYISWASFLSGLFALIAWIKK